MRIIWILAVLLALVTLCRAETVIYDPVLPVYNCKLHGQLQDMVVKVTLPEYERVYCLKCVITKADELMENLLEVGV